MHPIDLPKEVEIVNNVPFAINNVRTPSIHTVWYVYILRLRQDAARAAEQECTRAERKALVEQQEAATINFIATFYFGRVLTAGTQ